MTVPPQLPLTPMHRYLSTRLGIWRQKGRQALLNLLAHMGIPLEQSKQKYNSMVWYASLIRFILKSFSRFLFMLSITILFHFPPGRKHLVVTFTIDHTVDSI